MLCCCAWKKVYNRKGRFLGNATSQVVSAMWPSLYHIRNTDGVESIMSDTLSALFVISYLCEMPPVGRLAWLCDPLYTIEIQRLNDFINDTFSALFNIPHFL